MKKRGKNENRSDKRRWSWGRRRIFGRLEIRRNVSIIIIIGKEWKNERSCWSGYGRFNVPIPYQDTDGVFRSRNGYECGSVTMLTENRGDTKTKCCCL
jgi:hypothetical protein